MKIYLLALVRFSTAQPLIVVLQHALPLRGGRIMGYAAQRIVKKMKYLCVHIEVLQSFILSENCYCWKVLGASAKGAKIKLYLVGKLILVVLNPLTPRSDKGVTSP